MILRIFRIIVGVFALFGPGFLLSALLYAGPDRLDIWERIGMSVGLSAILNLLIISILAQKWAFLSLSFYPYLGAILGFSVFCVVISYFREESWRTILDFWGLLE